MVDSEHLEVWNLAPHVMTKVGAQPIFNVVGRLKSPRTVSAFSYRLNDGPELPAVFNRTPNRQGRLQRPGDFSIDTIQTADLQAANRLTFWIVYADASRFEEIIEFPANVDHDDDHQPYYQLDLNQVKYPQQAGEIVDGRWQVAQDEGSPCLEIPKREAGYDRIMLFGRHTWTTAYEINARLMITAWTGPAHNVGLLFKWNPHSPGDGTRLPTQWSTGLGYYTSNAGLQIRYGVDVHLDERGEKIGSYVLAEKTIAPWRFRVWKMRRLLSRPKPVRRLVKRYMAQLETGVPYRFRLLVHPQKHALTVWKDRDPEPPPQLVVEQPAEYLPHGAVGIIAHRCGVRLYDYTVAPV